MVGTLIDFETGILDYVHAKSKSISAQEILEAYANAEDHQHHLTPRLPFLTMMTPMYRQMATTLELPSTGKKVSSQFICHPGESRDPDLQPANMPKVWAPTFVGVTECD